MPRKHGKRQVLDVEQIADTQPSDQLERRDGRLYLIDTNGLYAPLEVDDREDHIDLYRRMQYATFVSRLTKTSRVRWYIMLYRGYQWFTPEERLFRLEALVKRDREIWQARYGDSKFAVPDDDDVGWSLEREIAELKREGREVRRAA